MDTLSLITTRGSGGPTLAQLRGGNRRLVVRKFPYQGMEKTVDLIQQSIKKYRGAAFVRKLALKLTRDVPISSKTGLPNRKDNDAIADEIYDYIIRHDDYTHDPVGIERLQMPDATILTAAGDCDDMAILSGALLESIGVPIRIRLIGAKPDKFDHIYIQYQSQGGAWKSFDPTLALYPGYRFDPSRIKNSTIVPVKGGSGLSINGRQYPLAPYSTYIN